MWEKLRDCSKKVENTGVKNRGSQNDCPFDLGGTPAQLSLSTRFATNTIGKLRGLVKGKIVWWPRWDSNPRPPRCEPGALFN